MRLTGLNEFIYINISQVLWNYSLGSQICNKIPYFISDFVLNKLFMCGICHFNWVLVAFGRLINKIKKKKQIAPPVEYYSQEQNCNTNNRLDMNEKQQKKLLSARTAGVILWNSVVDCNRDNNSKQSHSLLLHSM